MADALSGTYRPSANFWAYRDSLRQLDAVRTPPRLRRRLAPFMTVTANQIADHTVDDFQISEAAWRCLQRLMPPREFDVLASRCVGFTRGKIAKRLSISVERVRSVQLRCRSHDKSLNLPILAKQVVLLQAILNFCSNLQTPLSKSARTRCLSGLS